MSGKALGWARDLRGLSGGFPAKAVLLLMADYADGKHGLYPSVATLAEELGCTERTVQRSINSLLSDELIERQFRTTERGKTTSSYYVLAVGREVKAEAGRGDTQSPLGVSDSHPRGDTQSPSPPYDSHHHINHQSYPESADALSAGARQEGDEAPEIEAEPQPDLGEAAFERLFVAWAAKAPDRVARPSAWAAWIEFVVPVGADKLEAAGLRYLSEAGEAKRGFFRHLDRWLKDRRFEPWLLAPEPAPVRGAPASGGVWPTLPEALRASFAEAFPPAQVASYAPVGWVADGRIVVAANGYARDWLRNAARAWLKDNQLQVMSAAEASARSTAA